MSMKPILFNTEMVRAILDGRKTCTRRIVKPQQLVGLLPDKCRNGVPEEFLKEKKFMFKPYCDMTDIELINTAYKAPYQPGDILYVRETWHKYLKRVGSGGNCRLQEFYGYRASIANSEDAEEPWKPSIHMPKEAARLFLRVTNVRVERLQDITENGAKAEGAIDNRGFIHSPDNEYDRIHTAKENFIEIWNRTINKSNLDFYGWDANPYVWVIEFERCDKPESEE